MFQKKRKSLNKLLTFVLEKNSKIDLNKYHNYVNKKQIK